MKSKLLLTTLLLSTLLLSAKTITIVGTADLQGKLEPSVQKIDLDGDGKREKIEMGGVSHLATLYKKLKKDNPNTVIVSAGDDLMGAYFHIFKGKAIFGTMSEAGYEILALGNHEFDKGSEVLASGLKDASFTTLCSDLNVSSSALKESCVPYVIKVLKKIYEKGNITNKMLKEIDEFGNHAFIMTLKGKYLSAILERSASAYGKGGLMHPSGLKYTIILPKKMQKIEGEKVVQKGERVKDRERWTVGSCTLKCYKKC